MSWGDTYDVVVDHQCKLAYASKHGKWHYYTCDTNKYHKRCTNIQWPGLVEAEKKGGKPEILSTFDRNSLQLIVYSMCKDLPDMTRAPRPGIMSAAAMIWAGALIL